MFWYRVMVKRGLCVKGKRIRVWKSLIQNDETARIASWSYLLSTTRHLQLPILLRHAS